MKWTYGIQHKMTASLLLTGILVLVFLNNLSERRNTEKISNAISTIYKDRLIVESYIFHYADNLQRISDIIDDDRLFLPEKRYHIDLLLPNLQELHEAYRKTVLTKSEAIGFEFFALHTSQIGQLSSVGDILGTRKHTDQALDILHYLSSIQIAVATQEMSHIKRLFSSSTLTSQLEIAMLIIIGAIVQALIFASRTLRTNTLNQGAYLN